MLAQRSHESSRARLVAAAAELFAEHGFHGTSVRDIAERAGVNVAAGNYYFGSKKALYLGVLREHFAEIRALLNERHATLPRAELGRLSREQVVEVLRARVKAMIDVLLGPPPGLHAALVMRELCDPSEALPVIVREFITPLLHEMEDIVSHLAPELDPKDVERCALSIIGQAHFYRFALPVFPIYWGKREFARFSSKRLADHIVEFSLGGLMTLAGGSRGRSEARAATKGRRRAG